MNYLRPELLDHLAAAFALGTLKPRAARRFARVMRQSRIAQQAVDAWHQQLNQLAVSVPPVTPGSAVWRAIQHRTTSASKRKLGYSVWWLSALGVATKALMMVRVIRSEPGWFGIQPASQVTVAAAYVGVLTAPAGAPALLVSSLRQGRVLTLKQIRPLTPPPGYVAQLWALPHNNRAPFRLGIIPTQAKCTLTLIDSSEKLFADVNQLAVSFEPAHAIDTAVPSAFALQGHCVKLW